MRSPSLRDARRGQEIHLKRVMGLNHAEKEFWLLATANIDIHEQFHRYYVIYFVHLLT